MDVDSSTSAAPTSESDNDERRLVHVSSNSEQREFYRRTFFIDRGVAPLTLTLNELQDEIASTRAPHVRTTPDRRWLCLITELVSRCESDEEWELLRYVGRAVSAWTSVTNVLTSSSMQPADILEALKNGDEPLQSRIAVYQRQASACLAYLQQRAFSSPRAAAIAHQWLYELQMPLAICAGYEAPVIADLTAFTMGLTPEDFGLHPRGATPNSPLP